MELVPLWYKEETPELPLPVIWKTGRASSPELTMLVPQSTDTQSRVFCCSNLSWPRHLFIRKDVLKWSRSSSPCVSCPTPGFLLRNYNRRNILLRVCPRLISRCSFPHSMWARRKEPTSPLWGSTSQKFPLLPSVPRVHYKVWQGNLCSFLLFK